MKDFSVRYPFYQPALMLLFCLLLNGCSLWQRPVTPEQPLVANEREQRIMALQQFELQATLGIKAPNDSISGNLHWRQLSSSEYRAQLRNTVLGISLFELSHSSAGSSIKIRGETYTAVDTSSLLLQLTGWSVPLHDMPLWLRGLPGTTGRDIVRDEFGRVTGFTLTDSTGIVWQLQYRSFFPDALSLPKLLLLTSSDTQIKLVIRNWQ
ncbi:lipoprotein insertase outer membrane protein LolB [Rheinheimera gaetbuli]